MLNTFFIIKRNSMNKNILKNILRNYFFEGTSWIKELIRYFNFINYESDFTLYNMCLTLCYVKFH